MKLNISIIPIDIFDYNEIKQSGFVLKNGRPHTQSGTPPWLNIERQQKFDWFEALTRDDQSVPILRATKIACCTGITTTQSHSALTSDVRHTGPMGNQPAAEWL